MKIAYIHDVAYPWIKGGAEKRNYEIAKRLANNHEIHIYCRKWWRGNDDIVKDNIFYHGIAEPLELYGKGRRSYAEAIDFAFKVLQKVPFGNYDIIDVFQSPIMHIFPSRISKKMVLSWFEVWGDFWYEYLGRFGIFGKLMENAALKMPDAIIVASEKTKDDVLDTGCKKKIYMVHNGIDLKAIAKAKPSRKKFDVLYCGRLIKGKQVDMLISATAIAKKKIPGIRVGIIGDGIEMKNLKSMVKRFGLEKNVTFLGFLPSDDEVYGYMKSAKVFCIPSIQEGGSSIVSFEANACGLPVICVCHPNGIDIKLIRDYENGVMASNNAPSVAYCILSLLKNKKALAKMKEISKKFVRKYDWDAIADQVENAYFDVL